MIQYRKATVQDIPELIRLRIAFLNEVMNSNETGAETAAGLQTYFEAHIAMGDYISWLALQDGQIIATGGILFYDMPPNFVNTTGRRAYILNVYTVPAMRRRGISKQVFAKLMEEAADRHIAQVSLHATSDGKALYQQFGFALKDNEMVWGRHI